MEKPTVTDRAAIIREAEHNRARPQAILAETGIDPRVHVNVVNFAKAVPGGGALLAPVITEFGSLMLVGLKDGEAP